MLAAAVVIAFVIVHERNFLIALLFRIFFVHHRKVSSRVIIWVSNDLLLHLYFLQYLLLYRGIQVLDPFEPSERFGVIDHAILEALSGVSFAGVTGVHKGYLLDLLHSLVYFDLLEHFLKGRELDCGHVDENRLLILGVEELHGFFLVED